MAQIINSTNLGEVWSPCAEEVEAFSQNGWLISPIFLPSELLDLAWTAIERFVEEPPSAEIAPAINLTDLRHREGAAFDHLGYLSLQVEAVRKLVAFPLLAAAAARLAGAQGIRLFHDRLIVKPPESEEASTVGWHTDRAYWLTCTSTQMLTAWIPFQDIEPEMGPLMVVGGSHRWPETEHMATSHRSDMDQLLVEAGAAPWDGRPEPMVLRRGQVSFHHCMALHGSLPNRGNRPRAALAVHLQPSENRYRLVNRPDGRRLGHTNDLLCRTTAEGLPDYADPAVFPLLWASDE